jgi:AraC-like DNA-binding protein
MNPSINVHREITPLSKDDSFLVFDRNKKVFDYPIHYHPEYELNLIYNGKGVKRFVGDSVEEISDIELVLVGPNLQHSWICKDILKDDAHEVTIQFHQDLFHEDLLSKKIMKPIKDMFRRSSHGILFSKKTSFTLYQKISNLSKFEGIDYFVEFLTILQELAISDEQVLLSNYIVEDKDMAFNSDRMTLIYDYVQKNFHNKIMLDEVSQLVNMSNVSFNRFIKKRTGKTFVDYLNANRISHAAIQLIESDDSVSQIAFDCGFNNIANFNRVFKKMKNCTPSEFRKEFSGIKKVF